jgi:hypothetical protein
MTMVADAMASTATMGGTIAATTTTAMGTATMAGAGIVRRRPRTAIITMRIRRTTIARLRRIVGIGIGEGSRGLHLNVEAHNGMRTISLT